MDYEKFMIDSIDNMAGKYSPYQVFTDWITLSAIAIQNSCTIFHDEIYLAREELYMNIANKYSKDDMTRFADMLGALALTLEEEIKDVLGYVYMKSGCGSKNTGQFFTPYHLAYLTAKSIIDNQLSHFEENDEVNGENDEIKINEPSTGGGAMVIAACQAAKEHGIDYQRRLRITAQDLDYNGVYMTYIQLSLLGVKAVVVQGDTLKEPYHRGYDRRRVFRTPAEMGVII